MMVPSFLYGTYHEAKSRCGKTVDRIVKGANWDEAVVQDGTVDTAADTGLLVLSGPNPALGGERHFHCYLLLSLFHDAFSKRGSPDEAEDRAFESSLKTAWGVLGALSPTNLMWVYPERRRTPLVRATLGFWDALYAEGERYTVGSSNGQDLWSVNSNLKYALANLGADPSILNAPLPGGLKALVSSLPGAEED